MTVYVLNHWIDYEGEETLGVFATRALAIKSMKTRDKVKQLKWDKNGWHVMGDKSTGYRIYRYKVEGYND